MAKPAPSLLDFEQIIQASFEEDVGALRTTAQIIAPSGETTLIISNTEDSIALGTSTELFTATSTAGKTGLDVNVIGGVSTVSGEISFSGLSKGLSTSNILITDVATKVPSSPLANRNGMSVRVATNTTVYFGNATVTSDTGYPKYYKEEISLDIQDTSAVDLYAICDAGVTANVRIIELA